MMNYWGFWERALDETPTEREGLRVSFSRPEVGWLDFEVLPLTAGWRVSATHLNDPFPAMIEWLERIIKGRETAIWQVDGESTSTVFVYLPSAYSIFNTAPEGLLALQYTSDGWRSGFWRGTPDEIVQAFYPAFRAYVEGADYDPMEWETVFAEDGHSELGSWDGSRLKLLVSPELAAVLHKDLAVQLELDLHWP